MATVSAAVSFILFDHFIFFTASLFSGDVRRSVFLFLLLICLVRTETEKISCKFLFGDFEGVVAGDLRTDTEVEGTAEALSVEEINFDVCSSVWFLNR
jgi:hypothetical protein